MGVDADVVERVLVPLLDNAGRHARGVVRIGAARSDGRVLVRVADDGPGVAAATHGTDRTRRDLVSV